MQEELLLGCVPPNSFFEEEVREGFFISSMMKKYWAAQLKVLEEIDRVCRKHRIRWFADCGTLLGAVRHKGFVPWDDDMDICMLRDEWVRFFEIAEAELPENYCILTLKTQEKYKNTIGRICNTDHIDYGAKHLENYYGCPYTVGIDIFPLDGLAKDETAEERRIEMLRTIAKAAALVKEGLTEEAECRELLVEIEKGNHICLPREGNLHHCLLLLSESLYMMYPSKDAEYVALMPFWVPNRDHKYPKKLFDTTAWLPFEYTYMPVPLNYDEVLHIEYGDYMRINKGGGIHDYPVYKEQEAILKDRLGQNPYRFTMPMELPEQKKTWKEICGEMLSVMEQAFTQMKILSMQQDFSAVEQLLLGCRSLANALREKIESYLSMCGAVIGALDKYDVLTDAAIADNVDVNRIAALHDVVAEIRSDLNAFLSVKKKSVLFLAVKWEWWPSMEPEWRKMLSDPDSDVYVAVLPYVIKHPIEGKGDMYDDSSLFPDSVELIDASDPILTGKYWDMIYIQSPYDEWCATFSAPAVFNSKHLRSRTDMLIYISCFLTDEPIADDDKLIQALRVMAEQPAVFYADKVIVRTAMIRAVWMEFLVSRTGEATRAYWEEKLSVSENHREGIFEKQHIGLPTSSIHVIPKEAKILLYEVNGALLCQYGMRALGKIRDTIQIIRQAESRLCCVFSVHETVGLALSKDAELENGFASLVEDLQADPQFILDQEGKTEEFMERCLKRMVKEPVRPIAGYYGSAGSLAHICSECKIPVMLMTV